MRQDLTDITLVVDRSGSMQACRADAEGGINSFIDEQKKGDGTANLTLVQFDHLYEFVHNAKPIKEVPSFTLLPRGNTALLDAVGRAIAEAGERLDKTPETERPACVVFVIVTDGQENASREFNKTQIKEMIEHQKNKYNWQFTFLGADASAFSEGAAMGIDLASIAQYSPDKTKQAYGSTSGAVLRCRSAVTRGESASLKYTAGERSAMK